MIKKTYKILTTLVLLLFAILCNAQSNFKWSNLIANPQANFYNIVERVDSAFQAVQLDTGESDEAMTFMRWKWFWESRMGSAEYQQKNGSFLPALKAIYSLTQNEICTGSSTYPDNWSLIGPISTPQQTIGRIDAVERDPNTGNNNVVYVGAPTSGLWKTSDITAPVPQWQNITNNFSVPGLGVTDILVEPGNSDVIYIATGNGDSPSNIVSNYGVGVLKTTNGTSANPIWHFTDLSFNPSLSELVLVRKLLMDPTDLTHQTIYGITDREVYKTIVGGGTGGGISWPSLNLQATAINDGISLGDIIIDPISQSDILVSGNMALWRYDNAQWIEKTMFLSQYSTGTIIGNIELSVSGNNIYALYDICTNCPCYTPNCEIHNYYIDISSDGGLTWSLHHQTNMKGPLFIVSSDQTIMYIGNNSGCVINKSTSGGQSFFPITNYNGTYNGTSTHADIRALELISGSTGGLNDVLLAGTDGGVLYSTSANLPLGTTVNWKDATGTGLTVTQFWGFANSEKKPDLLIGGAQDNGYFTFHNGIWTQAFGGDGYECTIDNVNPLIVYSQVTDGLSYSGGVHVKKSTNGGLNFSYMSWDPIPWCNPLNPFNPIYPDVWNVLSRPMAFDKNNSMLLGNHDVFRLMPTNTWEAISNFNTLLTSPNNGKLSAIEISDSDPLVIYAGFGGITWDYNNTLQEKLWKTTDGGANWENITHGLPINYGGISGIVSDPNHPERVWVSLDQVWRDGAKQPPYNGVNRVLFSDDGGQIWNDYSNGLPSLPINAIIYQKGSNDGLYVGTDVGVFYTNSDIYPNDGWVCYNTNFPVAIVTDLEINYCRSKLIASTFGRGLWESDLVALTPQTLYFSTIWNTPQSIIADLTIPNGVILTITSEVNISSNKKIIVQPGATLIIDGGKLTNSCGTFWQGIEVQGNPILCQNPATNQGQVIVQNGGIIENAHIGIWAPAHKYAIDPVTTGIGGGGIIKATDAIFRNCEVGVRIDNYHNFNPYSYISLPNRSSFTKCTFETTNGFISGSVPSTFIYLDNVEGINIRGNTFQNTNTSMALNDRGKGIISYDASYTVKPYCSSLWIPCPPTSQIQNNFTNLVYAINASNISTTKSVYIDNNIFNNNTWDIVLNSIEGARVTKNDINRGGGFSAGIYLNYCNGYKVEENTIDNGLAGIVINYSGTSANEIYNNTFTHNLRSCQAQGTNGDNLLQTGLQFKCNDFHNLNSYAIDINVTSGGIKPLQGYCLNDNTPAGNCFTFPTLLYKQLNKSSSASPFIYNSHSGAGCTLPSSVSTGIIVHQCNGITYNPSTSCLSHLNHINNGTTLISQISTAKLTLNSLSAQIDGGSTQNLLNKVSSNINSGTLKDFLVAASPYLTDTVLIAALNRNQTMTPGHIKDVIVPNSPLTTKVMNVLITKTLPAGIRKQIIAAQTGVSQRSILVSTIFNANTAINEATNNLINNYFADTLSTGIDSILAFFPTLQSIDAAMISAEAYLQKKNCTSANAMLSHIIGTGTEEINFVKYYQVLTDLCSSNQSIYQITPVQKQTIIDVALSGTLISVNARILLSQIDTSYKFIENIEDLILPDSLSIRGYLTEGNECNSLSISNDTLVLLDQNNALVNSVTPVVTDQNGYFHFDAMQLMMLDTAAKYTISPQNSFLIDSTYYKTIKEWISGGEMYLHVLKVDKVWERTFNSPDSLHATGQDIDIAGNIYVLGTAYNLQTGGNNITLLKYDSLGTLKWSVLHSTGQGTDNIASGLYIKDNSIYILGTSWLQSGKFNHNIVLAKYNTSGVLQWQNIYDANGLNDDASKIAGDNAGNIYVSGWSANTAGIRSAILIKTDSSGTQNWVHQNTHSCSQLLNYPVSILNNDVTGNLYITFDSDTSQRTSSFVKLNTSGTLVWETLIPDMLVRALIQDSTGNIYVSGNSATATYSSYVKKYATSGTIIWERKFDGNVYAGSDNLQINHAGKLVEAGNDKFGFTLRTIDKQNGNVLNNMAYKGDWFHQYTFADIAIDTFDNIYLTSTINDLKATMITNLIHTFKFSNTLEKIWELWDKSIASDIVVSKNGNIYLTGTKNTINNTAMKSDIVTYKYSQCTANANLLRLVNNQDKENKANQYVLLYPNPNDGNMTVEYNIPETETGVFEMYDIIGKKILSRPLAGGKNSLAISETQLIRGIYFYRASVGKKQIGFDKVVIIK